MNKQAWHSYKIEEIFEKLNSNKNGLGQKEAKNRLAKFGLNKLPEEKRLTRLVILFEQFKSPLIYILAIATVVSFLLKEWADATVILMVVVINTVIGYFQETKANRAIEQLKKMVEHRVIVLREGHEKEINTKDLVLGDIILLKAGDRVPADARLIENKDLQADEAALTGESFPLTKSLDILDKGTVLADRENMVFMGTTITRGKAKAVVCEIGVNTELGQIATLIKETKEEKTPLQKRLAHFSKIISIVILVICFIIFFTGVLQGKSVFEMFTIAVAVAVAAIPEGLIIAVTVILALGMQKILKHKALIRKLIAAETLGSTSVICTDKTGTLTEARMEVSHILTGKEELLSENHKFSKEITKSIGHEKALRIGLLCNNVVIENPEEELKKWVIIGDPTEQALLLGAVHSGLNPEELDKLEPRIDEIPFDSERKYMVTLNKLEKGKNIVYIKGAPEKILAMASKIEINGQLESLTKEKTKILAKNYDKLTSKGLRVLAVGYKKTKDENLDNFKGDIIFMGLIALKDPLRKEARETIDLCQKAGIRLVIVTGDHKLTAKAIGQEVGLAAKEENILEGYELDKLSDDEFKKLVKKIEIYARVEPKHKIRIVNAWQSLGEVVAMTGDGVNDAPAIKSADIGIALGSGTEVTKETSDMILMDDNFKTIVAAVRQGRIIYENIRKVILYLLSDSFTEVILIGGSLLLGLPLPVTAAQILWVNLVEDGLPNFALAFEPGEKEVMKDKPRKAKEPILNTEMKILIFAIGIITDIVLFGLYFYLLKSGLEDFNHIRTFIFTALGLDSLLFVFSCRSLRFNIWHKNPFSNRYLIFAVCIGFLMLFGAVYIPFLQGFLKTVPLSRLDWLILIPLAIFKISAIEITKWFFIVKKKHQKYGLKT